MTLAEQLALHTREGDPWKRSPVWLLTILVAVSDARAGASRRLSRVIARWFRHSLPSVRNALSQTHRPTGGFHTKKGPGGKSM